MNLPSFRSATRGMVLLYGSAIAILFGVGACGSGGEASQGPGESPSGVVLELRTSGSRTVFMPDSLSAPAGAQVVLRLINEGEVAHNVVFVLNEDAVQPIVLAAYQAIATEYVPEGFDDDILLSTPLVYPGETFETSFTMPGSGRYTYVCVFPTHGSTMRGTLTSLRR